MVKASGAQLSEAIASFRAARSSVHEQLALVDFIARLTFSVSVKTALANGDFHLTLSASPGLGSVSEALSIIGAHSVSPSIANGARSVTNLLAQRLPATDRALQTIEGLRNHLFHGGGLPADAEATQIAEALADASAQTATDLADALMGSTIRADLSPDGLIALSLSVDGSEYPLAPFAAVSPSTNALLVFSRLTSNSVVLNAARHENRRYFARAPHETTIGRVFRGHTCDTTMSDLTQTVLEDLEGFHELGTSINYSSDGDGVGIHWIHADGNRSATRLDRLRVGPENAWQWYCDGQWLGYSDFLRTIANWSILSARFSEMMKEKLNDLRDSEAGSLPLPHAISLPFIAPMIQLSSPGSRKEASDLTRFTQRLDADVESNRGTTCLYFIHAEAGAGKSTTLLNLACTRANQCSTTGSVDPLFLYVSARGNVLENLDTAINAAVAATHVLTSEAVLALCRNGIVIPFIDGFDELVGSPTYSDALSSLRPWLRALGGRGVLVVSARSSYFLTLFEESIRRETNRDINVRHCIVELDRWTPTDRDRYFTECGVPNDRYRVLPSSELEILRLPFFARASIPHLLAGGFSAGSDLIGELIQGYIDREHNKLQGSTGQHLVSVDELYSLFEELALWMMENSTREVSWDDLLTVAEVTLSEPLTAEVRNRLVALCGLNAQVGGDRRFRFSHEMFLDFFVGRRVGAEFANGRTGEVLRVLSKSKFTRGAARVAARAGGIQTNTLLELHEIARTTLSGTPKSVFSANLGILWEQFLNSANVLNGARIESAEFEALRMDQLSLSAVVVKDCSIGSLSIGSPSGYSRVMFERCNVQELRITGTLAGVVFDRCTIDVATSARDYCEEPNAVLQLLTNSGAQVLGIPTADETTGGWLEERARFFLEKIDMRVATSIVVAANRLPEDDPRIGWATRNPDAWQAFLRIMEEHELAYFEPISAGGPPKFRVRLAVPPGEILYPDGSLDAVQRFWDAIRRL